MGKRGFKKGYLYRTVIFIVLVSLLPVLFIGILMNRRITQAINEKLISANEQVLRLMADTVESVINQMKNACIQLENDSVFTEFHNIEGDTAWYEEQTVFRSDEELRRMYQYLTRKSQVFDRLASEKMTNSFVESVYYIDFKLNVVLTSDREIIPLNSFYDVSILDDLDKQLSLLGAAERTAVKSNGESQNEISIFYGSKYRGDSHIFVINLHPQAFYDYLDTTIFKKSDNTFLILQNNGTIITKTSLDLENSYRQMLQNLLQENNKPKLSQMVSVNDENSYLVGVHSDKLNWWIFSVTKVDELFESSNYVKRVLLTVCVTLAVVICIAIVLWSINWYRPIQKIMNDMNQNKEPGFPGYEDSRNEMIFIYNGLQFMKEKKKQLQGKVLQMLPGFQEKYLLSLLNKEEMDEKEIQEKLQLLNIPISVKSVCLIIFLVKEEERRPTKQPMENAVEQNICIYELIHKVIGISSDCYFVLTGIDRFTVVLNWEPEEKAKLFQLAQSCGDMLTNSLNIDYHVGISRIHESMAQLPEAYLEAQQALSCSMFLEDSNIARIEDIVFAEEGKGNKRLEIPLSIFSAIRAGKETEAVQELLLFFKRMTLAYDNLSYARVSNLFLRLLSRLYDFIEEMNLQDEETDAYLRLANEELLNRNELLAMETMKRLVGRLAHLCGDRLSSKCEDRVSIIKKAVEAHYADSFFSVADVAADVGLHPDYLNRIFKESTGKTFGEYLTSVRIGESLTLLKKTDLKIKEISEAVGYNNTNYFIKVFKENMKITPKEYRSSFNRNEKKPI